MATRDWAIVVEQSGQVADFVVAEHAVGATLADVVSALGADASAPLAVDGRPLDAATLVTASGLRRGSLLSIGGERSASLGGRTTADESSTEPTRPFVRGPRRSLPPAPLAPSAVVPAPVREPVPAPGVAALVVPIAIAAVTALMWNPMFAVVALISPTVMVLTWCGAVGRSHRTHRRNMREHVSRAVRGEVARRRRRLQVRELRRRWLPAAAALAAQVPSGRMWERRPRHEDFMAVRLGCEQEGGLVTARLGSGVVVGVVGEARRHAARALLTQVAFHHGPADCTIGVVGAVDPWDWVKWLPHSTAPDGEPAVARGSSEAVIRTCRLVLVDGVACTPELSAALEVLDGSALVLAESVAELPGVTSLVIDADESSLWSPGDGARSLLALDRLDEAAALEMALAMAPFHDPERAGDGLLPDAVRLVDLLGATEPEDVAMRWKQSADERSWCAPIGRDRTGVVHLDLRRDGPHALVGGTTGSGKSEFLRTLVVALAASLDPTRCNFVLIDYKGGSAFDACAGLPHTVGVVTDLDEGLAERALVCLDAEVRRRERLLRDAGASDVDDYSPGPGGTHLPRLVVVIDEFAAMASELPDFVGRLVDIAQRGRSLGVQLVLATQRPSGVVDESIRANVDLRIALRVQSAADSRDVVGVADAADIPRTRPGRAIVRLGATTMVQTAYTGGEAVPAARVTVRPYRFATRRTHTDDRGAAVETELERLVASIATAADAAGLRPGPSPWPEPLPASLTLEELEAGSIGLIDDPARQRRIPLVWSPEDGHLLLVGLPGSGTTTALATLAVVMARRSVPPDVYVLTADPTLDTLARLSNVGAVVVVDDEDRVLRLLRMLVDREDDQAGMGSLPTVLLIDGLDTLLASVAATSGEAEVLLTSLFAGDAGAQVSIVGTVRRVAGVPQRILGVCPSRVLFRLPDRYDYRALGCEHPLVDPPPGRAVTVPGDREVQMALPLPTGLEDAVRIAVADAGDAQRRPPGVSVLESAVEWSCVSAAPRVERETWLLPVGIDDRHRRPALLRLDPGGGALVAGPAGSGKTTALLTLATGAQSLGFEVVAVAPPRSSLHGALAGAFDDEAEAIARIVSARGQVLVIVDDADRLELSDLVAAASDDPLRIRLVGSGLTARLRRSYGSWVTRLGEGGAGLLLDARPHDGEVLGITLPRRRVERTPGRGWLTNRDDPRLVQVALPPT